MFESQVIKTDVTAVKLVDKYILAGVGNFLHVYRRNQTEKLLHKQKIFNGHIIYGMETDDLNENLLLFGGCSLKTLLCNWNNLQFNDLYQKLADDWILTAKWLNNTNIATTLMSNVLIIYNNNLSISKKAVCDEKCILYSSFIHFNKNLNELLIFSGTVFNEILVWKVSLCKDSQKYPVETKLKGHKGVIFSISYNDKTNHLSSSSDDRSTIIWSLNPEVNLKSKVYGHQSRIFRCKILENLILTGGEDGYVNVWTCEGKLVRKIEIGGAIWALDSDGDVILTGSGNSSLTLTCLSLSLTQESFKLGDESLKRVGILRSQNVAVITEKGVLYWGYKNLKRKIHHEDLANYSLLEVSKCRTRFSLAGFRGEIYIYEERNNEIILINKANNKERIFSFHWLTCLTFLTCQRQTLTLWCLHKSNITEITTWSLPNIKDLSTTAACQTPDGKYIVGDRKGNLHVFLLTFTKPVQFFKAHDYLGVTKLYTFGARILSLGRNGTVRSFKSEGSSISVISSDKVPFNWLIGLTDGLLLTFSGENFLIWDYLSRRTLIQFDCGGGHRSWDFSLSNDTLMFVFIKNNTLNVIKCARKELYPKNIIAGDHCYTVNSLKLVHVGSTESVVVSGGEDTNLRICALGKDIFKSVKNLKSHLSSIRAIFVYKLDKNYLIFSGGGRGQIVCWKFDSLECSEQCSYYEKTESENRVMDLHVVEIGNKVLLLAATSEGTINIFSIRRDNHGFEMIFVGSLFEKHKCLTKLTSIKIDGLNILLSMSIEGIISFWKFSDFSNKVLPCSSFKAHQSGINSCCCKVINTDLIILTGGDDNCIRLNSFCIRDLSFVHVGSYSNSWSHCAQVTGCFLTDDYFLTTSIDQKLIVFIWKISQRNFVCEPKSRYDSAVADIQGMECWESEDCFAVFLYGKGIEYVKYLK